MTHNIRETLKSALEDAEADRLHLAASLDTLKQTHKSLDSALREEVSDLQGLLKDAKLHLPKESNSRYASSSSDADALQKRGGWFLIDQYSRYVAAVLALRPQEPLQDNQREQILQNYGKLSLLMEHSSGSACTRLNSFIEREQLYWQQAIREFLDRHFQAMFNQVGWLAKVQDADELSLPVRKSLVSLVTEMVFLENPVIMTTSGLMENDRNSNGSAGMPVTLRIRDEKPIRFDFLVTSFLTPILKRFQFHFIGDRPTNRVDKPEWYLTFLLNSLGCYETIDADLRKRGLNWLPSLIPLLAKRAVDLAAQKILVDQDTIVKDDGLLNHTFGEVLLFDRRLLNLNGVNLEDSLMNRLLQYDKLWELFQTYEQSGYEKAFQLVGTADQFVKNLIIQDIAVDHTGENGLLPEMRRLIIYTSSFTDRCTLIASAEKRRWFVRKCFIPTLSATETELSSAALTCSRLQGHVDKTLRALCQIGNSLSELRQSIGNVQHSLLDSFALKDESENSDDTVDLMGIEKVYEDAERRCTGLLCDTVMGFIKKLSWRTCADPDGTDDQVDDDIMSYHPSTLVWAESITIASQHLLSARAMLNHRLHSDLLDFLVPELDHFAVQNLLLAQITSSGVSTSLIRNFNAMLRGIRQGWAEIGARLHIANEARIILEMPSDEVDELFDEIQDAGLSAEPTEDVDLDRISGVRSYLASRKLFHIPVHDVCVIVLSTAKGTRE
eukprot:Clim_evm58s149 gene=Clim_evmTU58s149